MSGEPPDYQSAFNAATHRFVQGGQFRRIEQANQASVAFDHAGADSILDAEVAGGKHRGLAKVEQVDCLIEQDADEPIVLA